MGQLFKSFEYGTTANPYDWLKALALLTMVVDHLGRFFFPEIDELRVIGRIAAPIFLFLVGFNGNFAFNRYLLAGAAIVSVALYATGEDWLSLNILWSILVWRWLLGRIAHSRPVREELPVLWLGMVLFYIPAVLLLEYGTLGLMFALLGWLTRQNIRTATVRGCWVVTFALWIILQSLGFHFTPVHTLFFIVESLVLFTWLYRFRLPPATPPSPQTGPAWLHVPVILLARNTLVLYVAHVVVFALIRQAMLHS